MDVLGVLSELDDKSIYRARHEKCRGIRAVLVPGGDVPHAGSLGITQGIMDRHKEPSGIFIHPIIDAYLLICPLDPNDKN